MLKQFYRFICLKLWWWNNLPTFFHGRDHFWRLGWPQNGPIQPQNDINRTCCLQFREPYLESFKCAYHTQIHGTTWLGAIKAISMHPSMAFWGSLMAIPDGKKAQTHRPTYFLPRTNLVPLIWSSQNRLWRHMSDLWHFGAVFGHKNGHKGQNLMGSTWISYFLNQTDKIEPLIHPK